MAVAGILFAGALVALALRWEVAFWVLFGLTMLWQLVSLERPRRAAIRPRPTRDETRAEAE
ncbi:hypothetical protein [Dactylosporangium sp. NPDC048998]|uniref:hypothetical protein n=1 Tax=Dactylosporangium sp. NPDC048998 TaxID=3363976 RepID=UPI0037213D3B